VKFDIALPFYGDVEFLKEAVASVLVQTDPNWHLLVVDDGHPDSTLPAWFEGLNDSRISYLRNEKNLGANGNFQRCLSLLSAEYCLVMGADDILEPNFIEVVINTITKYPNASMIHPGIKIVDEENNEISTRSDEVKSKIRNSLEDKQVLFGEPLAASLMKGNWMYFPAITWQTKSIQEIGFRSEFNVCQDLGLAMDVIMQGGQMVLINEEIFNYRRHLASDSSVKAITGERFIDERRFFQVMTDDLKSIGWNKAAHAARLHTTSRLHAASLIPACIAAGKNPWNLVKHLFSWS
jgi:cellulose synthase/poly-beta-1,6-N-acetylglucosamine synthase-like glycosyltransferase